MDESRIDRRVPDAMLAEAFRERTSAVGAIAGASRVFLREPPSDTPSPILRPVAERSAGRYQVLGEIARGGVGVVLKGHDNDLGRDVAMKLLREEHAKNADVVQRFVEEAQIGGQLQHPGIVPVYELGVREDGRPYFAMKLVKGRTLSALTADRKDLAADRARFVSIFERVCQTVAYAHSRGVVHRDLKPSNVMVGAFGEVQVVDWGLAKVLRQGGVADERRARPAPEVSVIATVRTGSVGSESVVGSVLGTPAYMPPEQARGMVDALDERSDVFSLGAVLCEILTGKPPYVCDASRLLQAAAKAELDDAFARLDACGADEKLVRICKGCLAAAPAARPTNAGELAEQVSAYLAAVEHRLRKAEIESAQSAARADAERGRAEEAAARADAEREKVAQAQRAKRMTLALAAVVLVAVVGGGLAWRSEEISRRDRAASAERTFSAALEEARLLHRRADDGQDIRRWDEAEAAAKRLDAAAAAAEVPATAGGDTAAFHSAFDAELANARAAAAADARAVELVRAGDDAGSIAAAKEAIRRVPKCSAYHSRLYSVYFKQGNWRRAAEEARIACELDPSNAAAATRLATALVEFGELAAGRDAARRAVELAPDNISAYLVLGTACAGLELWDESDAANKEALRWRPGWASAVTNFTTFTERRKAMPALEAALRGERPVKPALWADVAYGMVRNYGRFGDAVACCERWMAAFPEGANDVEKAERYNAACYAARAGAGEGRFKSPVDDAAKAEYRAKARKWLAAEIAEWRRRLDASGDVLPAKHVDRIKWWKEDGDLSPIRDEEFTSKWPEDERKGCAALWADVDALLARIHPAKD